MVKLRSLDTSDAELMLEWMHDPEIIKGFQKDLMHMTLDDSLAFCKSASSCMEITDGASLHYAVADEETDEYLGTISLKHLDLDNRSAEYAITLRRKALGSGAASEATKLLLDKAFGEIGLHKVWLNVLEGNARAIAFYEKMGFVYEGILRDDVLRDGKFLDQRRYSILESEWKKS